MKAKKALKRLNRVEALLSGVLHQYASGNTQMRTLLTSAQTSVSSAKEAIGHPEHASTARKPLAKAEGASRKQGTGPIRKDAARTAKKRRSPATRTTNRRVTAHKAVTKTAKRTVLQRAKPSRKSRVSSTKAKAINRGVSSRGAVSRATERPVTRGTPAALPAASNQMATGPVRKPAINDTTATRVTQPERSAAAAPKPAVDAGSLGGEPVRQG
jgi:hypothetical protein